MTAPALQPKVDQRPGERPRVLAPAVGWWSDPPRPGTVVGPGSTIGRLRCLNRVFVLVLAERSATGTVEREASARTAAVGFGELLFSLRPLAAAASGLADGVAAESHAPEGAGEARVGVVRAPTDGVFYRRPSPGARPFVEVGSRVRNGQPIGLVEVMKTFNQILYGGPGLPEEGEVVEIRCEDGGEVSAGQALLVVR